MYSSAQAEALMRLGQEALQEDLKRKERAENNELRKACLTELLKEDPKNIWYHGNVIRVVLAIFFAADTDLDGRLTVTELLEFTKTKDNDAYESVQAMFNEADVSKDSKLNLAGILGGDRKAGYVLATKS
ncbi:hypothetical protein CRV24_009423 [Beauveria bassiana]|nr:hypothetical protein CRV24_009423 [Beauveria bassiana]KAH8707685.1 hypothetical protein HC256_009861 [Beauveria bassiana]